ncbi:phosphate-starvation-inducible PsiE family protein [Methylobacillus gramineus]|uniref:phosphate-starvation-inducible PsiE family protein n=1 Tax=Methylobacillus gramineus TaxID=755169 RepID=UPI001CFFBE23|nr:phosphate-starvation-inducible PsiE family protein [Methylobacillus gramineus]MCB5184682.1 phosphate-starvation-inducible PsiE family protein [Methylobacillus gramineus]
MAQNHFPREFNVINRYTIRSMLWLNGFAHITIGLALAISVLMFAWLFFLDVRIAFSSHNLVHGFLNALGTLMLLWSISALISAEIRYLMGAKLEVETFIEVAMVLVLRKLIIMPVQEISPDPKDVLLWVGAGLMLGITFVLVRWGQKQRVD